MKKKAGKKMKSQSVDSGVAVKGSLESLSEYFGNYLSALEIASQRR
jgi:hypothetical protein